jgi:hypothetical protein
LRSLSPAQIAHDLRCVLAGVLRNQSARLHLAVEQEDDSGDETRVK